MTHRAPAWMETLVEVISACVEAQSPMGPLGYRYLAQGDPCELLVYPTPVELGVKFTSDVAGTITGIRFYKSAANTGTHIGSLWTADGTRLASATFTGWRWLDPYMTRRRSQRLSSSMTPTVGRT